MATALQMRSVEVKTHSRLTAFDFSTTIDRYAGYLLIFHKTINQRCDIYGLSEMFR